MIEVKLSYSDADPIRCNMILDNDGDDENGRPIYRRFYMCPKCGKAYNTAIYPDSCERCGQHFKGCELI